MGKPKHVGKWTYSTHGCSKGFFHKQSLFNHKLSCINAKISCSKCKKTFSHASYLKIHKCTFISHTCSIYNKEFKKQWFLKRHMNINHSIDGKKVYTCKICNTIYKRKDHFDVHIRKCKGEPKRKISTLKRAWDVTDEMFMPTMLSANEMQDFNYDNPIRDMALHSQEQIVESLYEELSKQVDTILDEAKAPSEQPSMYILDDFVDFLPVADEPEHCEKCLVSHDDTDNNDQKPIRCFMKKVSLA